MADGNIYDDPDFHAGYVTLNRQVRGLAGAAEWPVLQTMVPPLSGARVVDLGCGFGWFSRWAVEQGAVSVLGVDVSTRMLERARADTDMAAVTYQQHDLDQLTLAPDSADLVFSSLALHYVKDLLRMLSVASTDIAERPELAQDLHRPWFLLIGATKLPTQTG